jgi:hypothetical protein
MSTSFLNEYFKEGLAKVERLAVKKSVEWLCSDEAAKSRYKRLTEGQDYPMITHQYVLHIEVNGRIDNPNRFQEIDADNIRHALKLAERWLMVHNATSVGIRKVARDGSLGSPDIYDWSDFMEDDQ